MTTSSAAVDSNGATFGVAGVAGLLLLGSFAAALAAFLDWRYAIVAALGLVAVVTAVVSPRKSGWAIVLALMALGEPIALTAYDVGIRIFAADYLLLLLVILFLRRRDPLALRPKEPVTIAVAALIVYGIFALLWALLATTHEPRAILGDYRRFYLYPAAVFLGIYLGQDPSAALPRLLRFGGAAALAIGATAVYRIITGSGFRPHQFGYDFRAFSFYDSTVLFLPLSYLLARAAIFRRGRFASVVGVAVLGSLQVASGYRLTWGLLLLIPMMLALLLTERTGRARPTVLIATAIFLVGAGTAAVTVLNPQLLAVWTLRLGTLAGTLTQIESSWRFLSWLAAFEKFQGAPILGVGIGDTHTFWALSYTGAPSLTTHTTHNIVVSLAYQTGLVGIVFFLAVHLVYVRLLWNAWQHAPTQELPTLAAIAGFYIAALAYSNLQPFLNSPGGASLLYGVMGISLPALRCWAGGVSVGISRPTSTQVS